MLIIVSVTVEGAGTAHGVAGRTVGRSMPLTSLRLRLLGVSLSRLGSDVKGGSRPRLELQPLEMSFGKQVVVCAC